LFQQDHQPHPHPRRVLVLVLVLLLLLLLRLRLRRLFLLTQILPCGSLCGRSTAKP
jgi:hypothetical protein